MDMIKQNRYLWFSVIFLVSLNIFTLAILWIGRPAGPGLGKGLLPPPQEQERIRQLLKEQLNFNDAQVQRYLALRDQHRQQALQLESEIRELKHQMFSQVLEENAPAAVSDSLLNLALAKQAELEKITFRHFLDLKNLCGPGQKEKLRLLMGEVFRRNQPPRMPEGNNLPPQDDERPRPPRQ